MRKTKKLGATCAIFSLLASFLLISCNNIANGSRSLAKDEVVPQKVVIGDELIYGEYFSFQDVYAEIFDEIENVSVPRTMPETPILQHQLLRLMTMMSLTWFIFLFSPQMLSH